MSSNRPALPDHLHFWAGGAGALVGALITGPLEMVKTRLQAERNKSSLRKSGRSKMPGTRVFHALRYIYSTSGVLGLWRGVGPHMMGVVPARAIFFGSYNVLKRETSKLLNDGQENSMVHFVSASGAGAVAVTATSPLWVVKTRMQLQTPETRIYKTSFDCFWSMVKKEGPRSLFKGLSASLIGLTESSMQFVFYEQLKKMVKMRKPEDNQFIGPVETLAVSSMAKFWACVLTYPHEVVRTRMREVPVEGKVFKHKRFLQSLTTIYREEGRVGLYGGMGAHLMRVVPNAALLLCTYEVFTQFWEKKQKQKAD